MARVVQYLDVHFSGVDHLWREAFPDDPARNQASAAIPAKLAMEDDLFFVALDDLGDVIGTVMAGWDGHRGWLYAVAVAPHSQRTGVGKQLVEHALGALRERGCIKVNLQIREGNETVIAFYKECGFLVEPRTSMGRTI